MHPNKFVLKYVTRKKRDESFSKNAFWVWMIIKHRSSSTRYMSATEALRLGRLGYGNKTTYIIYFEQPMAVSLLGQFKVNLKKGHDC
jgi:hypothetical protein